MDGGHYPAPMLQNDSKCLNVKKTVSFLDNNGYIDDTEENYISATELSERGL